MIRVYEDLNLEIFFRILGFFSDFEGFLIGFSDFFYRNFGIFFRFRDFFSGVLWFFYSIFGLKKTNFLNFGIFWKIMRFFPNFWGFLNQIFGFLFIFPRGWTKLFRLTNPRIGFNFLILQLLLLIYFLWTQRILWFLPKLIRCLVPYKNWTHRL